MNIDIEKIKISKNTIKSWTHSAINCYLRGGICKGCVYENTLESSECKMKAVILILVEKLKKPTKEQISNYYLKE